MMAGCADAVTCLETDAVVVGAGPCGLFAIFQLGINGLNCHVIDALDKVGGQCAELYPAKPIYDIPAFSSIDGQDLIDRLLEQASPFGPVFHLQQVATNISRTFDGKWIVTTSMGTRIKGSVVVIASGGGSFTPKRPPNLVDLERFEGKSIHYSVRRIDDFSEKKIVIAGGGDSAVDWALALQPVASRVTLLHHREELRAQPHSVQRLNALVQGGHIHRRTGRLKKLHGKEHALDGLYLTPSDGKPDYEAADHLLIFYGLTMKPGPLESFGIKLDNGRISVDTEKFESSLPGVFAVGDSNVYPGKLKLILSGFHEAALMAKAAVMVCRPGEEVMMEYMTSSPGSQKILKTA